MTGDSRENLLERLRRGGLMMAARQISPSASREPCPSLS